MDDFAFPWDHPPPKAKSATAAKPRRSSILKGSSAPQTAAASSSASSERNALRDIHNVNTDNAENAMAAAASKKMARRSSKRVSFSASKIVKEFEVGSVGTVWNTTYEEEHGQSTLQSSASSGGSETVDENKRAAADVPDGASRKRRVLQPETSDEVSPSKQVPLRLEIPARSGADGADSGNPYLPWGERGGEDLMLESPLVNQPRNTFLSSLASGGGGGSDLDKSTFHFDGNDMSSVSDLEASALSGADKTTRSGLDMDETCAAGPTIRSHSQVRRFAQGPATDRTMLFNKTGTDLLDMTACVQNEEARDMTEMDESIGELSLTTAVNPSSFLKSLGNATSAGSVSSMESSLMDRDEADKSSPHEEPMEITRVVKPDTIPESTNDKTMVALDEGMEMTAAIPSKKFAQNKSIIADPEDDSESTSQELDFTRAAVSSYRSITTTATSVSTSELTSIGEGVTEKSCREECMEMTKVVKPDLMSESHDDKTMVADEGMEMTLAVPSMKLPLPETEVDDSKSTSQTLEVTRASSLSSQRSTDVTHEVIASLIASDNGTKLRKPNPDETVAGMDEGMDVTEAVAPALETSVLPKENRSLMGKSLCVGSEKGIPQLREETPANNAREEDKDRDEDEDEEVTFNAASMLANPTKSAPSGTSSEIVRQDEREEYVSEREGSYTSNDEDEDDGMFKDPMELTKGITKEFRKKLAERSKSNSSSSNSPDDESILPESFLESKNTEHDSIFLHSAAKSIHGTRTTNAGGSPTPSTATPSEKSSSFEELLNPTPVDFSCVPGYQG